MKEESPTVIQKQSPPRKQKSEIEPKTDEKQLIGTFTFVLLIGGFLLVSWFGVYWLYLNRL